jgi:hypothetical protein
MSNGPQIPFALMSTVGANILIWVHCVLRPAKRQERCVQLFDFGDGFIADEQSLEPLLDQVTSRNGTVERFLDGLLQFR